MKKIFLTILFFLLLSTTAFSQVGDITVPTTANVFSCKDDVCAVKVTMTVRSPFYFSTGYIVDYDFVDGKGQVVSFFQTEMFVLQGNESRTLEKVVLMDKARLETVKQVRSSLRYFAPPIKRGGFGWGGYGPRYWQGTCPRAF